MENALKPSERLLKQFIPLMEGEGFAYRKSGHRFLKPFAHANCEFSVFFDSRAGCIGVDAAFFVHFDALEKVVKKMGWANYLSAGGTLREAGAVPWKIWLTDERFADMPAKERSSYSSDVVHPPSKIQEGCDFLLNGYRNFAVPLFDRLRTYRDLADFYRESRLAGYGNRKKWDAKTSWGDAGRLRPRPDMFVYMSLLVAAYLRDDVDEILDFANDVDSSDPGRSVAESVEAVLTYIRTAGPAKLLE